MIYGTFLDSDSTKSTIKRCLWDNGEGSLKHGLDIGWYKIIIANFVKYDNGPLIIFLKILH